MRKRSQRKQITLLSRENNRSRTWLPARPEKNSGQLLMNEEIKKCNVRFLKRIVNDIIKDSTLGQVDDDA